jgi:NMD protein affecting ribosome stability and mRNA decay
MQESNLPGKNIDSYCGRCKVNLEHTIMTMDGDTVARVRCKSCGSTHKYRGVVDPATIRKPRAKKASVDLATAALVWEARLNEAKGKERDYLMNAKYRVGDVVNHHAFGKGIVMKLYTNKCRCEMLFKDRERLMASMN